MSEQAYCGYEHCQRPIETRPGHRRKEYCNEVCRQAAHRLRKQRDREWSGNQSNEISEEHESAAQAEIRELRKLVQELEAGRAEWRAWKEAEVIGYSNLAAVRQYLHDHLEASVPIKRNGVTVRVDALGDDGVAVTDYGIIRLSDEELEQARIWVCKRTGEPVIVTRVPIGSQDLEQQQAKYVELQTALKQAIKKVTTLERQVQRFERMNVLQSRESMLQDLMILGGRLKYACLTDLEIGEGIDQWLAYVRAATDQDLAVAIAHGYFQADSLAMAAIEASDSKRQVQMQQRIRLLESDLARRDARIAELEQPETISSQLGEVSALLYRLQEQQITVERQQSRIEELESEVQGKIDRIHQLEESHSSTIFTMNSLLAATQSENQALQTEPTTDEEVDYIRDYAYQRVTEHYAQKISVLGQAGWREDDIEQSHQWIINRDTKNASRLEGDAQVAPPMSARDCAKDLIRLYVLRGDSVTSLARGHMGSFNSQYHAHIGGLVKAGTGKSKDIGCWKIAVTQMGQQECCEIFSLRELYAEIQAERGEGDISER